MSNRRQRARTADRLRALAVYQAYRAPVSMKTRLNNARKPGECPHSLAKPDGTRLRCTVHGVHTEHRNGDTTWT